MSVPEKIMRVLLLIAAAGFLLTWTIVALMRLGYPFELEWMEGGMLMHVDRILAGQKLYIEPSLSFVPYIYPPFYPYVSALICELTGTASYLPLRLLSFIATAGCMFLLYMIAKKESGNSFAGMLAAALYAATFAATGGWFDIARVDSLYLLLLLKAIYAIRFHPGKPGFIIAGLILSLAFFTKQTTLVFSLPLLGFIIYEYRKQALFLIIPYALVSAGISIGMNLASGGWYRYYIFELPGQHDFLWKMFAGFWPVHVLGVLPIAFVCALWYIWEQKERDRRVFGLAMLLSGLAASYLSMVHGGGYQNNMMPFFAVTAVLFALSLHALMNRYASEKGLRLLVLALALAQFAMLIYQPWDYVPTEKDRAAGQALSWKMRTLEGKVFTFANANIPGLEDKGSYAHAWASIDVLRGKNQAISQKLESQIRDSIRSGRYDYILMDFNFFGEDLEAGYELEERLFEGDDFVPVSGGDFRPVLLYRKK